MWVSESALVKENGLDALVAAMSVMLALALLLGASGHLIAVWPAEGKASIRLLTPGLLLLAGSVFNLVGCAGLWRGRTAMRWTALLVNGLLALYLARLLTVGVPDHPIGIFLALICSQLIVLAGVTAGLEWRRPAATRHWGAPPAGW